MQEEQEERGWTAGQQDSRMEMEFGTEKGRPKGKARLSTRSKAIRGMRGRGRRIAVEQEAI
eukprot:91152-Hanusia_phi.AAC.3